MRRILDCLNPDNDSASSRTFDLCMQVLIFFGIILFTCETLPDISAGTKAFLAWAETVLVAIFTLEYVLRIVAATKRMKFVLSPFGIIDLLAILPFYLSLGVDLRSLRVLRWFRLFRALKLLRYSRALWHFGAAMTLVKEQVVLYLMATSLMVYFAAAGIYFFEHEAQPDKFQSILHSLWWAIVTLTSVGYGDCYPMTAGGRIFTGLLLPVGLGVITVPSGLVAYGLTKSHEMRNESQDIESQDIEPQDIEPDEREELDDQATFEALMTEFRELRNMLEHARAARPAAELADNSVSRTAAATD